MVLRLVSIYGRANGVPEPVVVELVNPEHISSLRREVVGTEPAVELFVTVKVEAMPLLRTWFGVFATTAEAESRWSAFLADVTGDVDNSV